MENKIYYNYHKNKYSLMDKQDIIKLVFQATLGPNHFGANLDRNTIINYINNELRMAYTNYENLYEWISDKYIRINLFKYIENNLDIAKLIDMFIESVNKSEYNKDLLKTNLMKYLNEEDLKDYNYQAVSHSNTYKDKYLPHYRVVDAKNIDLYLQYIQLNNFIMQQKNNSIIAIEGRCGSGKSTLADLFKDRYTVIRIDDFFIEKKNQTKDNINSIYGNINYKNIYELLKRIKSALNNNLKEISFYAFDCSKQEYYLKTLKLTNKVILEGTYSSSTFFSEFIDKLCFLNVDKETQFSRIKERKLATKFFNEWIPLEEQYFKNNDVLSKCDIII